MDTGDTAHQTLQLRFIDTALPVREIDRMILAKSERTLCSVDRNRDKAFAIAAMCRLIANPVGLDRCGRPADDDSVGLVELGLDQLGKGGTAIDQCVPPDGNAGGRQCIGDRRDTCTVGAGIAQEDRGAARR